MAQSIFNGTLRLGEHAVAVKLYSAVEDRRVHFRLLHAVDGVPVRQRMVHPDSGDEVPRDEVVRGYESEAGMVMLRDEELEIVTPARSRDMEIEYFVDPERVDLAWYQRPYYLGPGGDPGAYAALCSALRAENKLGIVRWVMRKKVYHGALRSLDDHLLLVSLRFRHEVVPADGLPAPSGRELTKREREMARQLVSMLEGDLDLGAFEDEYRERVLSLIRAKAEGRAPELPKAKRKRKAGGLANALSASIEKAKERKVA